MLNDLLDAISERLGERFAECRIYLEGTEAEWVKPCFFVSVTELSGKPATGGRSFRESGFRIQYFPAETGQKNREMNQVLDGLLDGMEIVTLADGSPVRGTKLGGTIEKGILSFSMSCNLYRNPREEQVEMMETVEIKEVAGS